MYHCTCYLCTTDQTAHYMHQRNINDQYKVQLTTGFFLTFFSQPPAIARYSGSSFQYESTSFPKRLHFKMLAAIFVYWVIEMFRIQQSMLDYTVKTPLCTKQIYLLETNNIVQSHRSYLEQKQIMLYNNKFTLKQINILH